MQFQMITPKSCTSLQTGDKHFCRPSPVSVLLLSGIALKSRGQCTEIKQKGGLLDLSASNREGLCPVTLSPIKFCFLKMGWKYASPAKQNQAVHILLEILILWFSKKVSGYRYSANFLDSFCL